IIADQQRSLHRLGWNVEWLCGGGANPAGYEQGVKQSLRQLRQRTTGVLVLRLHARLRIRHLIPLRFTLLIQPGTLAQTKCPCRSLKADLGADFARSPRKRSWYRSPFSAGPAMRNLLSVSRRTLRQTAAATVFALTFGVSLPPATDTFLKDLVLGSGFC